jgi:hypothetical protein
MRLLVLCLCCLVVWCEDAAPPADDAKLPAAAKASLEKLAKAEAKLEADYNKGLAGERQKTVAELDKAMKAATKAGDLDAALAVKARIEALQKQIGGEDLLGEGPKKPAVDLGKQIVGRWQVDKSNGINAIIEFQADGGVVAAAGPFTVMGRWHVEKDGIDLIWGMDPRRLERLQFEGPDRFVGDSYDAGPKGIRGQRMRPPRQER